MKFSMSLFLVVLSVGCTSTPKGAMRCPADVISCEGEAKIKLDPVNPLDRFAGLLAEHTKGFPAKESERIEFFSSESLRNVDMQLQGLCKVYMAGKKDFSEKEETRFDKFRLSIKELEDSMGQVSLRKSILERAQGLKSDKAIEQKREPPVASAAVIEYAEKMLESQRREHAKFLAKEHWLPNPQVATEEHMKLIGDIDFSNAKKDQRKLAKYYLKFAEQTHEAILALRPHIFKDNYSLEDLEAGLHEFRRKVRWMTIILQALRGVFAYSENLPDDPEFKELYGRFGKSKYVLLREPSANHYKVDMFPFLRLSHIIMESGTLKDAKEAQLYLVEAHLSSGVAKSQSRAEELSLPLVEAKYGKLDVERQSQAIFNYYVEKNPIGAIIRNLRTAIGE